MHDKNRASLDHRLSLWACSVNNTAKRPWVSSMTAYQEEDKALKKRLQHFIQVPLKSQLSKHNWHDVENLTELRA